MFKFAAMTAGAATAVAFNQYVSPVYAAAGDGIPCYPFIKDVPIVQQKLRPAPYVPDPVTRNYPVRLQCKITSMVVERAISPQHKYEFWTFDGCVPGPMIRGRVGDWLEIVHENEDEIGHNIDFHSVTGPGGGAPALFVEKGQRKTGMFKLLFPGVYVYHCAAAPVPTHVANGMYGLIVVEPAGGLPRVDKEFYVVQSEFYGEPSADDKKFLEYSYANGLAEHPKYVVFNGKVGSMIENPLMAKQNDRVRVYFGNGGPNLISSFHVIGVVFDYVWREGDFISPPGRGVQTTCVPAGGSTCVEFDCPVQGNFIFVDHSVFRFDKGTLGFLKVAGEPRPDIYDSTDKIIPSLGPKVKN